jgi:NAD(P)-dependent dehydrogenase (short-subunit alcohol dehydrogenase family)
MPCLAITGASSGIGYATAKRFYEAGYSVINLSRRTWDIAGVINITCDLTDPDFIIHIESDLRASMEDAETICLVHNAARLAHDTIAEVSAPDLRSVYEINLVAPAVLNRTLLPTMKAGSSILYVGSTLGEKAVPGSFSYVTSKHATIGMMRASCQDLAGSGVHTACINPGFTDTEMLRDHIPADVMPEIAQMSAYGRLIDPAEIANALFFAAQNPVINGSVINANLGQIER